MLPLYFSNRAIQVTEIHEAYKLLPDFLGKVAPYLFAVALIAAGQSSTITGTLAGQIVMEGYLSLRINPWLRRLITRLLAIIPALIVIIIYGDQQVDSLLILSQVILSLQLGFAIIPLIHFVSDKSKMKRFAIKTPTKIIAWLIATVLIWLNVQMLVSQSVPVFEGNAIIPKIIIAVSALFFSILLLYIIAEPVLTRRKMAASIKIHPEMEKHYSSIFLNITESLLHSIFQKTIKN